MRKCLLCGLILVSAILALGICWDVIRWELIRITYTTQPPAWIKAIIWGWV